MNVEDELTATLKFIADVGCGEKIDTRRMTTIPTGIVYSVLRTVWFTDTRDNTERLVSQTTEKATERFRATYAEYRAALDDEIASAECVAAAAAAAHAARHGSRARRETSAAAAAVESAAAALSISPLDVAGALSREAERRAPQSPPPHHESAVEVADPYSGSGGGGGGGKSARRKKGAAAPFAGAGVEETGAEPPAVVLQDSPVFHVACGGSGAPAPAAFSSTAATAASASAASARARERERDLSAKSARSAEIRCRLERYYADLAAARCGIGNLCTTYADSIRFRSRLNTLREKIDRFLATFSKFAAPVPATAPPAAPPPSPGAPDRHPPPPASEPQPVPAGPTWARPPAADEF